MGGRRQIFNGGYPATSDDLQSLADAAARADELASRVQLAAGTAGKGVFPLTPDGQLTTSPHRLVLPGVGTAAVLPAFYAAYDTSGTVQGLDPLLAGAATDLLASPPIASNATGSTRYDVVYATLYRVATTGARKTKDTTTGAVATQTVQLHTDVAVQISLLTGNATQPTGATNFNVPADSATAWNFPLAVLAVPNGYAAGGTLSSTAVLDCWTRLWQPAGRARGWPPGSLMSGAYAAAANGRGSTVMRRYGDRPRGSAVFQHHQSSGVWYVLDNSVDYRNRILMMMRFVTTTQEPSGDRYPAPQNVVTAGQADIFQEFKGYWTVHGSTTPLFQYTVATSSHISVRVNDSTGALEISYDYAPLGTGDNNWYIEWEFSGRFDGLGVE